MEILRGLTALRETHCASVLTIGNFDGVHMGHQKILRTVVEEARAQGAPSMAITFDPHPLRVLVPERSPRLLTPPENRARLLKRYGMDIVLLISFSREFANLPPENFIRDILVGKLAARMVIVGHGYAFGKGKRGSTEFLRRRGKKYGFEVRVVRNARMRGDVVSSSRIRGLVTKGRVARVAELLGRPYSIEGSVVKGAGRGAKLLGTPTANISTAWEVIPKDGVYAVRAAFDEDRSMGRIYDGVANTGTNPTFKGTRQSLEAHLFGYEGDLIGSTIRVGFIERIREEHAFPSPEALRGQILKDITRAKEILKGKGDLRL